jgi:hypothetical protein
LLWHLRNRLRRLHKFRPLYECTLSGLCREGVSGVLGTHGCIAEFLPRIAAEMRVHGCTNLKTETVKGTAHYVVEEKPEMIAELIERYAARD